MNVSAASAQQEVQLSLSPLTFELKANPGETVSNSVRVTNNTTAGTQLEVTVENIASTGQGGQVELTSESTTYALSSWVSTDVKKFSLGAKESKIITFTIAVPKNAEPGGHYGSLLIGTVASGDTSTGAIIAQKLGSLLLVRVSGEANEEVTITGFVPKNYVGSWDEITSADGKSKVLVPKDEVLTAESSRRYFSNGPIAIDVTYQNKGNVHVKPVGFVSIYNIFNKKVAELPVDSRNVFPGADRKVTVIWPQKQHWGIFYRAKLITLYGASNNKTLSADATFWAFPLPAAISLGVVLLVLLILRKRLGRALRILFRGA